jgi:hypothetical protein
MTFSSSPAPSRALVIAALPVIDSTEQACRPEISRGSTSSHHHNHIPRFRRFCRAAEGFHVLDALAAERDEQHLVGL